MICRKCGKDAAFVYCVKCIDYRFCCGPGDDQSSEIVAVGKWPATGTCEFCGHRQTLPAAEKRELESAINKLSLGSDVRK